MKTVSFETFLKLPDSESFVLVDLNTTPAHMAGDYYKRNNNILNERKLCDRCQGTGNELYSMYRKCTACNGSGAI